jgi:hypothetical protein
LHGTSRNLIRLESRMEIPALLHCVSTN